MNHLTELIDNYGKLKSEMDSYKKQVEASNLEIKSLMAERKLDTLGGNNYIAKYQIIKSESFDNDKLIQKLKSLWSKHNGSIACPYLKMIYVPNMEEIEKALYNGELLSEDIADCKIVKESERLTVSKRK